MNLFQIVAFVMLAAAILYAFISQLRKKKPNAIVWWHADKGGGIEICILDLPHTHLPYKLEWDFFGLIKRDVWLWYEDKIDEIVMPDTTKEVPAEQHDDTFIYCKCGFKQPKDKQSLMNLHLRWEAKKGDKALFDRTHSLTTAVAARKEAIKGIVEAQKQPLVCISYVLKPYEPKPIELIKPKEVVGGDPRQKPKEPITSPNSLWDTTNWQCAVRFGTIPNKMKEAIKLGIGIGMFAICVVALIMIIDMVQKGQTL